MLVVAMGCMQSLFAQQTIINDANAQIRDVKGFHAIEVSSAINLYMNQSNDEAVAVSASDSKYRDKIRTEVKNGVLKIWLENENWFWGSGNKKLKAYVSFKSIDHVSASGASDVFVDGVISGESLAIHLSGASDFKGAVKLKSLTLDQSGASDITIRGSTETVSIDANGASNVKAYDLVTDQCTIKATGASDVRISANKEINARASGASSIYYKGDAVIRDLHTSGASNVGKN